MWRILFLVVCVILWSGWSFGANITDGSSNDITDGVNPIWDEGGPEGEPPVSPDADLMKTYIIILSEEEIYEEDISYAIADNRFACLGIC